MSDNRRYEDPKAKVWRPKPKPTWKCEYCGQFYSERTGAKHAYCLREYDRSVNPNG